MDEVSEDVKKILEVFPDATVLKIVNNSWDIERFRQFVKSQDWRQATSAGYQKYAPHQYTIKGTYPNPEQKTVIDAGRFIDKYGLKVQFYGNKIYTIFVVDGWRYWYMKNHDESDVGVNRAKITDVQGIPPEAIGMLSVNTEIA